MSDDNILADRFSYQLSMFEMPVAIGLSRILHDHIVQEIVISKIINLNLQDVGSTPMHVKR